ncbi:MAG: hypothetical protein V2A71_04180 [Candidatus Eisenbacteria bacterium]
MKKQVPLLLTFIAGTIPIVAFFVPERHVGLVSTRLDSWLIIVYGFALLLGVVNVVQMNTNKIKRRGSGWPYAVVLLAGLAIMGSFGFAGAFGAFGGIATRPDGSSTPFDWLYKHGFLPLQGTMFALLAFFMASASYRAFRARNVEATILLIAALIVMFGRIPFGEMVSKWIPATTEWIMSKPNMAAQRGIMIGAALGAASMALRVIVGIERSYLGIGKGE